MVLQVVAALAATRSERQVLSNDIATSTPIDILA
jgi:hypothetical protein